MAVGIVMAVVSVTVVLVLLSRMQNKNKAVAVADLASDREASKPPDILELVNQEVQESGIGSLPGADGVDPTVLLKVWKRDGTRLCRRPGDVRPRPRDYAGRSERRHPEVRVRGATRRAKPISKQPTSLQ